MPPPILLHIGYPKTASTWLQQALFVNAEAAFETPVPALQIKEAFFMVNEHLFSPSQIRVRFAAAIEAVRQRGHVAVLSDEWFTGNQVTAEYRGREMAGRLHATFPEALVLVVFNRGFTEGCDVGPPRQYCPEAVLTTAGITTLLAVTFGLIVP